ncbi:hypothetical protein jhhlp_001207 [Lomentospora prolificans]|uniref:Uncharacterized protein n=1 Tax=Lomentospora prolificans TaxID=41688 RepID=A0A2N3NHT8_9PEZI|nr:hypothetical protein jhhlp_001207 [Lomentospora prolificans]
MEGDNDDPWSWGPQRLAEELCRPDRPWYPKDKPQRFVSFETLSSNLQKHDVDGELLLSYTAGPINVLLSDLGAVTHQQLNRFHMAIQSLKQHSATYQAWKRSSVTNTPLHGRALDTGASSPVDAGPKKNASLEAKTHISDAAIADLPIPTIEGSDREAPSKKRRRLSITKLTTAPTTSVTHQKAFHIPTEADLFVRSIDPMKPDDGWITTLNGEKTGYFGTKGMRWVEALEPDPLEPNDVESFQSLQTKHLVGRSLHVNRGIKALLNPKYEKWDKLLTKFTTFPQPNSLLGRKLRDRNSHKTDQLELLDDEIIGPWGEDDEDESVDLQTMREIQQEKEDMARYKEKAAKMVLSQDAVNKVLDEAVSGMIEEWKERKEGRLQQKAYAFWTGAQKTGRLLRLQETQDRLRSLDKRMDKLRDAILSDTWTSERKVHRQSFTLEQTVWDRQAALFHIDILLKSQPPKKPNLLRPSRPIRRRRDRSESLDPLEEELTSEDELVTDIIAPSDRGSQVPEQDLKERTVEMEEATARIGIGGGDDGTDAGGTALVVPDSASTGHLAPVKQESSESMDIYERLEEPELIDLTLGDEDSAPVSPVSSNSSDVSPSLNQDEEVHSDLDDTMKSRNKATSLPESFWNSLPADLLISAQDRYLIERIWALHPETHSKLQLAAQSFINNPDLFWTSYILKGLDSSTHLKTLPALITRLFIYWFDMSTFQHAVLFKARKDQRDVMKNKHAVVPFIDILARVIPCFPKLMSLDDSGVGGQVAMDAQALKVRQMEQERAAAMEKRRQELRRKLKFSGPINSDKSRLIINEAKEEGAGLIYISGNPALLIKEHQIEGVRFLWNQIVVPSKNRNGCLLAHTMGLGKTMQVITLLLSIVKAASSPDPSIHSQIPEDLRESRTVVLCPASLALNWRDEILLWDPDKVLGEIYIISAATKSPYETDLFRQSMLDRWVSEGGILIIGYPLLARLVKRSKDFVAAIHKKATIVVADEAHGIKNEKTQMRQACGPFETRARIALTGSPLANNINEYYSMIDWVAPGYLGDPKEFDSTYSIPIQKGLWKDSGSVAQKLARVALLRLSRTISPKVHRLGMIALKDDLPPKKEFVIFVPPTEFQRQLYDTFTNLLNEKRDVWGAIPQLTSICAHPKTFIEKAKDVIAGYSEDSDPLSDDKSTGNKGPNQEAQKVLTPEIANVLLSLAAQEPDPDSVNHSWRFKHLMVLLDECRAAGDKVLVFSRKIRVLDFLEALLRQRGLSSMRLDGNTPMKGRLKLIKEFNTREDTEVFLISTKAGGVGLNMHGANRVVMLDFEHNPVWEQQAVGRAYRIGQTKPVFVYWFVVWGTHEWKLHSRSVFKNQLSQRVVDSRHNLQSWSQEDLAAWVGPMWDKTGSIEIKRHDAFGATWTEKVVIKLPESEADTLIGSDSALDRLLSNEYSRQGVLSVITTDAFEEDDPLSEPLTPGDIQEATRVMTKSAGLGDRVPQQDKPQSTGPYAGFSAASLPSSAAQPTTSSYHPQFQAPGITPLGAIVDVNTLPSLQGPHTHGSTSQNAANLDPALQPGNHLAQSGQFAVSPEFTSEQSATLQDVGRQIKSIQPMVTSNSFSAQTATSSAGQPRHMAVPQVYRERCISTVLANVSTHAYGPMISDEDRY